MTNRMQNITLGTALLILSSVWIWLVIDTIPTGFGRGDIGPRAFPLLFGICLAGLSILLVATNIRKKATPVVAGGPEGQASTKIHWLSSALILLEISVYGVLLKICGFVIATPIVIVFVMLVNLRIRSVKQIFYLAFGTTFLCWLIFEKALGIYLANGSWINLG